MDDNRKKLGQYFTTNVSLRKKVVEFIHNNPKVILEPSVGQGDLVQETLKCYPDTKFDMYEIDDTIKLLNKIDGDLVISDFLEIDVKNKYDTIIGNPPYIRTKHGNSYIDFTSKCFELLNPNGELVFIAPSDIFKLTCSSKLMCKMFESGTFTDIYHPHDEHLFKDASIDILIFRYCKNSKLDKKCLYNDELKFISNSNGLITFNSDIMVDTILLSDLFSIHVGLVSGKESIYKNDNIGTFEVLNKKDKIDKYIFINKYPSNNKIVDDYLLSHKDVLIKRKIKKFNENNWYEWGAPRNIKIMESSKDKPCIFMYSLTRSDEICWIDTVKYYGSSIIMLLPKKDNINLEKLVSYFNSKEFTNKFIQSGRFKIGQRQISNILIEKSHID